MTDHLGGHGGRTWVDAGALSYLCQTFEIKSMLDIGCGVGGMRAVSEKQGVVWTGIEGDPEVQHDQIIKHDFTQGVVPDLHRFDLGWSVEFLEHVMPQYQLNYMHAFQQCDIVVCTAAPPNYGGHHHVNEQAAEYWHRTFRQFGFEFLADITAETVKASTMRTPRQGVSFMRLTGMVFSNTRT